MRLATHTIPDMPVSSEGGTLYQEKRHWLFLSDKIYNKDGDLLFCGILDQIEIVTFLFKVIKKLNESGYIRKLVIAGKANNPASIKYLQKVISEMEIEHLLNIRGFLSEKELLGCYSEASALLAPLPNEDRSVARFPTKLGEYLASSRPVVTSRIGDIPVYLTDGESALLNEPGDVDDFVNSIIKIIENPEWAIKIGRNGSKLAMEKFNPELQMKRLEDFLVSQ